MGAKKFPIYTLIGATTISGATNSQMSEQFSNDIFNFVWYWCFSDITPAVFSRPVKVIDYMFKHNRGAANFRSVWRDFFHLDISMFNDGVPSSDLKSHYVQLSERQKYSFLEFAVQSLATPTKEIDKALGTMANNRVLAANNSRYRFIGQHLVPITNTTDTNNLTKGSVSPIDAGHINKALIELHRTKNRNTSQIVAEAFAAIESALKTLLIPRYPQYPKLRKYTAGELIKFVDKHKVFSDDPSFNTGLSNLYGFANQTSRHGQAVNNPLSKPVPLAQAIYILEICSAFINFAQATMQNSADHHSISGSQQGDHEK